MQPMKVSLGIKRDAKRNTFLWASNLIQYQKYIYRIKNKYQNERKLFKQFLVVKQYITF